MKRPASCTGDHSLDLGSERSSQAAPADKVLLMMMDQQIHERTRLRAGEAMRPTSSALSTSCSPTDEAAQHVTEVYRGRLAPQAS
mmetsp:Transcript_38799/g.122171  ORF Transcript_38799/g.122171 Transcript_38799/m.122171 type:complete len:85 (+) Transcript_38799:238-492(+)